MKLTYLPLFKRKFLKPCKKLFKFKLRRPLFTRSHRVDLHKRVGSFSMIRSFFRLPEREMDGMVEASDTPHYLKAPHPSPLTPAAYVRTTENHHDEVEDACHHDEVEDACRNFDKYLLEMIVQDGKMRNLSDVEELLHCWNNLNSPVFIDLVCRFYRQLCKDLFSNTSEDDIKRKPKTFLR